MVIHNLMVSLDLHLTRIAISNRAWVDTPTHMHLSAYFNLIFALALSLNFGGAHIHLIHKCIRLSCVYMNHV